MHNTTPKPRIRQVPRRFRRAYGHKYTCESAGGAVYGLGDTPVEAYRMWKRNSKYLPIEDHPEFWGTQLLDTVPLRQQPEPCVVEAVLAWVRRGFRNA